MNQTKLYESQFTQNSSKKNEDPQMDILASKVQQEKKNFSSSLVNTDSKPAAPIPKKAGYLKPLITLKSRKLGIRKSFVSRLPKNNRLAIDSIRIKARRETRIRK